MDIRQTKITLKEIQEILPTFSRPEILELDRKIHEYLETVTFSKAAEAAFYEWNDPEEAIYDED
ncbi:MAG: hypothetical protein FJ123_01160 [Deltaproteobacteria bacterium]|nr:hypothetical protein [Deltaproteobacteria bacterium]